MSKKALVLSGGSIKGAFETGAIKAVLESGFEPDIITGISVGSLNGSFVANEAGKQMKKNGSIDWPKVGGNLYDIWVKEIRKPADVAKKRSVIALVWHILNKKFKGIRNSAPIDKLLDKTVDMDNIKASGVELVVGTVNMCNGGIMYKEPSESNFLKYVKGSKAIPFIMQAINIDGHPHLDGGLRDSAPLKTAIDKGATEITAVLCHSEKLDDMTFDAGDILQLAERVMSLHINETVNNDIAFAQYCNLFVPADGSPKPDEPFKGYRKLKITVIRPKTEVKLNIGTFNAAEIRAVMDNGYATAQEVLGSAIA